MGGLSRFRVQPAKPFVNSGVDYCGPFMIRDSKRRGSKSTKAYVAIFICLATKSKHMEVVSDLTCEGFLNAFKRFNSRRGNISNLYSDNGTNFVGAQRELKDLKDLFLKERKEHFIADELAARNVQWHFIPPRASHFGVLWEAAVKSTKYHLRRVAGEASLTFEEFYTLLSQAEAILNSRPLVPLIEDPTDSTCLTPGHFLIGDSLTSPLEPNLENLNINRLTRWQRIEQMRQQFWTRWSKDYLNNLQQCNKCRTNQGEVPAIGRLVIIKENDTPPLYWPMARVKEVYPGPDGEIRAATIQNSKGVLKRPTNKLCLLPIDV